MRAGIGWFLRRAHLKWVPTFRHVFTSSQSVWDSLFPLVFLSAPTLTISRLSLFQPVTTRQVDSSGYNLGAGLLLLWLGFWNNLSFTFTFFFSYCSFSLSLSRSLQYLSSFLFLSLSLCLSLSFPVTIYIYIQSSYDDVISTIDDFFTIESKYCNTEGRSVWTARGTMLKNKPHFFVFYGSIMVKLWTF